MYDKVQAAKSDKYADVLPSIFSGGGGSAAFSALVVQNIQSKIVPRTSPLALARERVPN